MTTRIANVRLDADRQRKARVLREHGVALSDLVREAIDARYGELERLDVTADARTMVRRLFAEHPDPPDLPERTYDPHDRRVVRRQITGKLRASKRR